VRELRNLLQRAVMTCRDSGHRPATTRDGCACACRAQPQVDAERAHIRALLDTHGGHRNRVATALDTTERTLYPKLKRHGLT
jgi:two-component system response regulator AtoC